MLVFLQNCSYQYLIPTAFSFKLNANIKIQQKSYLKRRKVTLDSLRLIQFTHKHLLAQDSSCTDLGRVRQDFNLDGSTLSYDSTGH
mmetsp:Transcript_3445/g.7510  ORF Transcript_3445/g.7510 Transcript_3445/m.7510 type:complete len:86 (-) Transcript_3445:1191-1448(-)